MRFGGGGSWPEYAEQAAFGLRNEIRFARPFASIFPGTTHDAASHAPDGSLMETSGLSCVEPRLLLRNECLYTVHRHIDLALGTAEHLSTAGRDHIGIFVGHGFEVLTQCDQRTLMVRSRLSV